MSHNTLINHLKQRVKEPLDPSSLGELPFDYSAPSILEIAQQVTSEVPEDEWEQLPKDLAENYRYYKQ